MALDCAKLSSAINSGCPAPSRQYERVGWIAKYEDVVDVVKTNNYVKFKLHSGMIPIYDRSPKPFNGTTITVEQGDYYVKFNETVQFPVLANDIDAVDAMAVLKNEKVVIMLEAVERGTNDTARYPIYGLNGGLRLATGVNDSASDIAWLASLTDSNTGHAGLFVYDTDKTTTSTYINLLTAYDWIGGAYLNNGDTYAAVTSVASYYYNTSGVLTSFSGTLAKQTYSGSNGWNLIYLVPKTSTSFQTYIGDGSTDNTKFRGSLSVLLSGTFGCINSNLTKLEANNASAVYCSYSVSLTSLRCKNAVVIDAYACALTAESIEQILDDAVMTGAVDGDINVSGGTNAGTSSWSARALALAGELDTNRSWTITSNL